MVNQWTAPVGKASKVLHLSCSILRMDHLGFKSSWKNNYRYIVFLTWKLILFKSLVEPPWPFYIIASPRCFSWGQKHREIHRNPASPSPSSSSHLNEEAVFRRGDVWETQWWSWDKLGLMQTPKTAVEMNSLTIRRDSKFGMYRWLWILAGSGKLQRTSTKERSIEWLTWLSAIKQVRVWSRIKTNGNDQFEFLVRGFHSAIFIMFVFQSLGIVMDIHWCRMPWLSTPFLRLLPVFYPFTATCHCICMQGIRLTMDQELPVRHIRHGHGHLISTSPNSLS